MTSRETGLAGVLSLSIACLSGASAQTTAAAAIAPASPLASMAQGLVGLVIVVAMIYAVSWAIRKFGPRTRSSGAVQIVGGASVGPREKVVVVRFGHQTLLLGVAPGQVSLLQASDTADVEPGVAPEPVAPRFVDRLRAARGGA